RDTGVRGQQAQHGACGHTLSGAGLSDDAQELPTKNIERDLGRRSRLTNVNREIADAQQRFDGGAPWLAYGPRCVVHEHAHPSQDLEVEHRRVDLWTKRAGVSG